MTKLLKRRELLDVVTQDSGDDKREQLFRHRVETILGEVTAVAGEKCVDVVEEGTFGVCGDDDETFMWRNQRHYLTKSLSRTNNAMISSRIARQRRQI